VDNPIGNPRSLVDILKDLKAMWKQGIPTFGPVLGLNATGICEILGHAGFDFCLIDLEHGAINLETAENMVRATETAGMASIIRVAHNRPELISQALDLGAGGVHIPTISTREEAQEAVWASKFAPLGGRGVHPAVRASRYSADQPIYFNKANNETIVVLAIEGTKGVDNIGEILKVKCIDAVFVGPYDLSQSLGIVGQVTHPKVVDKIQEIIALSKKADVAVGIFTDMPEGAKDWAKQGVLYCCSGLVAKMLFQACSDYVKRVRR
jgi:4-hydroxy-2-oxoheptanedioate aldolase